MLVWLEAHSEESARGIDPQGIPSRTSARLLEPMSRMSGLCRGSARSWWWTGYRSGAEAGNSRTPFVPGGAMPHDRRNLRGGQTGSYDCAGESGVRALAAVIRADLRSPPSFARRDDMWVSTVL